MSRFADIRDERGICITQGGKVISQKPNGDPPTAALWDCYHSNRLESNLSAQS